MRALLFVPLLLSACSMTQENGVLTTEPAPMFRDQNWHITEQKDEAGKRICTVGAGELRVAQYMRAGRANTQVSTTTRMLPGTEYKIVYGNHIYYLNGHYTLEESHEIVEDFLKGGTVYTTFSEPSNGTMSGSHPLRRLNNTISLKGFAAAYKACTTYVAPDTRAVQSLRKKVRK